MNDRDFRKLKAGRARAILAVCGLLGLAFAAGVPVRAQEAVATNAQSGSVVTAYLDYQEVPYAFTTWGVALGGKAPAFKKVPALSGSKVNRGTLQLGATPSEEMGFVWDRTAGKLYLDLNRNLDLTDDPVSVCPRWGVSADSYQCFTNIRLPFKTPAGIRQMLVDINLYSYNTLSCSVAMRSFWQGKVSLRGDEWQMGLLENPFGQRASSESGHLLLRPWRERNRAFSLLGGSLDAVPFSPKLFVNNHAYQLQCTNEVQGDSVKVRLQFTEQSPKLGELKIAGAYVQRALLERGPYLVVLDKPGATVGVPVGQYAAAKVLLKKGDAEAYLDGRTQSAVGQITVNEKRPALLNAGGPLTNSVSVSRRGTSLALNYQLVGVGGAYQLVNQDRSHPPEFTIYHGDKKIASGKFEFG
jgi:hypothetical protein